MRPPDWVCREVEKVHPICRLGYEGGDVMHLIELWRVRERPTTIMGREFKGRIFGSKYDLLMRVPLAITTVPIEQAFSGEVINVVRRLTKNFAKRRMEALLEEGRRQEAELRSMAEEMGKEVYWQHKKGVNGRGTIVPDEQITPFEKSVATGEWREQNSLVDSYIRQNTAPAGAGAIK